MDPNSLCRMGVLAWVQLTPRARCKAATSLPSDALCRGSPTPYFFPLSSHVSTESSSPSQIRFQSDEVTWFHLSALPGPAALAELWRLLLYSHIHLSALRVLLSVKPQNTKLALIWCWSTLGHFGRKQNESKSEWDVTRWGRGGCSLTGAF